MKAILPHSFYIFASQFTLESMLNQISFLSYHIFCNPDEATKCFAKTFNYTITINHRVIKGKTNVVQTWIIDLYYDLVVTENYGEKDISKDETIYLITLYNDYCNVRDKKLSKKDILLFVYGFFGEQKDFQTNFSFKERFSREKYILDNLSCKEHSDNTFGINIPDKFVEITGYTTDCYSALVYFILLLFIQSNGVISQSQIPLLNSEIFTQENIITVLNQHSADIDDIRNSSLKRQFLYTKPILKIGEKYISANAFLINALFENSNYWILRNDYQRIHSQHFINAFGIYFEMYVEEVLKNCLSNGKFSKIPTENDEKRADWIINIENYTFIVEQKSSLSLLGIKQNQPDIEAMKRHILKTWGEAVRQLNETQADLSLDTPIKIILVYEDYYKAECLEELFRLDSEIVNDYNYWLMTINEFEMLFHTYKTNTELFFDIIANKIKLEHTQSHEGREMELLLSQKGISENLYIQESGIIQQYQRIEELVRSISNN